MAAIESLLSDPRKVRFVEWLSTPPAERQPQTQVALAEEIGVHPTLLVRWKKEPAFRAAWDAESRDRIGGPERIQAVLDQLFKDATDPEVPAASRTRAGKEFLVAIDAMRPPAVEQAETRLSELSKEELDELIAEAAQRELELRNS